MAKKKKVKPNILALIGVLIMVAGLMILSFVNLTAGIILVVVGAVLAIVGAKKKKKK